MEHYIPRKHGFLQTVNTLHICDDDDNDDDDVVNNNNNNNNKVFPLQALVWPRGG